MNQGGLHAGAENAASQPAAGGRLEKVCFDPRVCQFPKPCISVLPERPRLSFKTDGGVLSRWQLPSRHFRRFTRGRYALLAAYRLAGIGPAGALLAPAYHCISMLDPALALGAEISLYAMSSDLSPSPTALDAAVSRCRTLPRALLATHYFGRIQDFSTLRQWCDSHAVTLIEDCSHVLMDESWRAAGAGNHGHFVVASPYKFFPSPDGGLLCSADATRLQAVTTQPVGAKDELRGIWHSLQKMRASKPALSADSVDVALDEVCSAPENFGQERIADYASPSVLFSPSLIDRQSLRTSRLLTRHTPVVDLARYRLANYRRLALAFSDTPGASPLYPELADDAVPYMFPLRIATPKPHFFWLKQLGVPIWRWDEMARSDCPVATDYRLHLLHLPCHQSLTEAQLDWMIAAVRKTLQRPVEGSI